MLLAENECVLQESLQEKWYCSECLTCILPSKKKMLENSPSREHARAEVCSAL